MKKPFARSGRGKERLTLYIDANTKTLLQRAAAFSGLRLAEFIQNSAVAQAQRLPNQNSITHVSHDEFCRLLDAVENPPAPTDDLVNLLRRST